MVIKPASNLSQTWKGKIDKHILTNKKITGDKPSQQLSLKQVATQFIFTQLIRLDPQKCKVNRKAMLWN